MIDLHVDGGSELGVAIDGGGLVHLSIGSEMYSPPRYEGSYEADALFSEQVFPTRSKVMSGDFRVHAINYTEAPNQYGTTVTIGG